MEQENIQWHPAFIGAIQLELAEYRDSLEFIPEFQLTTEPLRIDCVIVKKARDVVIDKNIAAIFKEVNLLEYKSPGDYVSVEDFYKVYGYACLYANIHKTPIRSLTISFVVSRFPRGLFAHLKNERGYKVEENSPGIYTVKGDIMPMQVIDSRRLPADENLWLKALRKRLGPLEVIRLSKAAEKQDKTNIKTFMSAIAKANFQAVEEAMNMSSAAKSLEEVLERTGFNARMEAKLEARAKAEAERKDLANARYLIERGYPIEDIVATTELKIESVKKMYLEINRLQAP